MTYTMRFDDAAGTGPVGRVLTITGAPGGTIRLEVVRVDDRGRFWYSVAQGATRLEGEAVEGTPIAVLVDALASVRAFAAAERRVLSRIAASEVRA